LTLEGKQVSHLGLTDDGDLLTSREDDMEEQVEVSYSPALTQPARMETGKAFTGKSQMTIRRMKDGSIRDQGECQYEVVLLGRQSVTTPAGPFDAYVVRTTRTLRLKLARVTVVSLDAFVDGKGSVVQNSTVTIRPLGLMGVTSKEEYRLARWEEREMRPLNNHQDTKNTKIDSKR
jgi:hypothetical protein